MQFSTHWMEPCCHCCSTATQYLSLIPFCLTLQTMCSHHKRLHSRYDRLPWGTHISKFQRTLMHAPHIAIVKVDMAGAQPSIENGECRPTLAHLHVLNVMPFPFSLARESHTSVHTWTAVVKALHSPPKNQPCSNQTTRTDRRTERKRS